MAAVTSTAPQVSSKSPTIRRILREAAEVSNAPSPDYTAEPLETDLFEWHFTLRGPPSSVYSEGIYHGRIVLPPTYPLRPPSFRFTTPNGRFEANREICLSISGHHEETWQPAWGIRTAIVALRSFMETDACGQLGGLDTTKDVRRRLAHESRAFKCATCARSNADIIMESEKQANESCPSSKNIVQVPAELSMGWRDEMGSRNQSQDGDPASHERSEVARESDSDIAELAEGFVPTAHQKEAEKSQPIISLPPSDESSVLARQPRQRPRAPIAQRVDVAPLWIDRAIVALVIVLVALLLKVVFGV